MKNKYGIQSLEGDIMNITVEDDPIGNIIINFNGKATMENSGEYFGNYLDKLTDEIISYDLKNIKINFENLKFINSNSIKTLIKWFSKIDNLNEKEKFKIEILYSEKWEWLNDSLFTLKNLFPSIVNLNKMYFYAIHNFIFKKEQNNKNDFIEYPIEGVFRTELIKNYIIKEYKHQITVSFIENLKIIFDELPENSPIYFINYRFRLNPIEEFFINIENAFKLYSSNKDKMKLHLDIPEEIISDKHLEIIIKKEYFKSQRKALTKLLNDNSIEKNGKLIIDSLNQNFNINFTKPIITNIEDGIIIISRKEPSFDFGNTILFLETNGEWCSIKDCNVNNSIMCFSPKTIVNCQGLKVREKIKFILYKRYKHYIINLDPELERKEKVDFIYLDDNETKTFLEKRSWPIFPEPNDIDNDSEFNEKRKKAENYKIENYIEKKLDIKTSIPAEIYGKLIKLYQKENKTKNPNYEDIMYLYGVISKKFDSSDSDDETFQKMVNYVDNLLQ